MYPQSMFGARIKKNIKTFLQKIFMFYNLKNLCILHWQVFRMFLQYQNHCKNSSFTSSIHHFGENCSIVNGWLKVLCNKFLLIHLRELSHMSGGTRKPVFGVSDHVRHISATVKDNG